MSIVLKQMCFDSWYESSNMIYGMYYNFIIYVINNWVYHDYNGMASNNIWNMLDEDLT
jgi:hypothetical protein